MSANVRIRCDGVHGSNGQVEIGQDDDWTDISNVVSRAIVVISAGGINTVTLDLLPTRSLQASGRLSPQTLGRFAEILAENGYTVERPDSA